MSTTKHRLLTLAEKLRNKAARIVAMPTAEDANCERAARKMVATAIETDAEEIEEMAKEI